MKTVSLELAKQLKEAGGQYNYNMQIEQWKPITGYEGLYEVSNFGRIKSLPHAYSPGVVYLKGKLTNVGYYIVMLRNRKTYKYATIHRLVAQAFIPNPHEKKNINHIDGNKLNNNVLNLEWSTYSENNKHVYTLGRRDKDELRKTYVKRFSKRVGQYTLNNKLIKEWGSVSEAARGLRISIGSISLCATGKKPTACGFIWRYL